MKLIDVSNRLRETPIEQVFALSVGYPTPEKLAGLAEQYRSEPSWSAYAFFDELTPVGLIGLELRTPVSCLIRHLSVAVAKQRSGIGRRLIEEVRTREALTELYAETHSGAVPFYRRCGFVVKSLGELHPGVERFACWWRAA